MISKPVLISDAPDGASTCGKQELLGGHPDNVNSQEIPKVVITLNELRVQEEDKEEQDKIQNSKNHCTGQHRRDQVAPEITKHKAAKREGNDRGVHCFPMKPEIKCDKNDDDKNKRCVVAFGPRLSYRCKFFFQRDLTHNRSNATNRSCPKKILDFHCDSLIEVEQRSRGPMLRDIAFSVPLTTKGDRTASRHSI
jgi:hypothetical protein